MRGSLSAEAYGGFERAVRPRLGHGDQSVSVGEAHVRFAGTVGGHGGAVHGAASILASSRRSARKPSAPSAGSAGPDRRPPRGTGRSPSAGAPRSRRPRDRRSGCDVRSRRAFDLELRTIPSARHQVEAVHRHGALGHLDGLTAARAAVRALAPDLHGRVGRRDAGRTSPTGRSSGSGGSAPVSTISPSGSPVLDTAPNRATAKYVFGSAMKNRCARVAPTDQHEEQPPSQTGRACPHAPPFRHERAAPPRPHRARSSPQACPPERRRP